MSKRICVYCSSSNILEEKYIEAAREFAQAASLLNYTVICGGSIRGLMGVIIDTMLSYNENSANASENSSSANDSSSSANDNSSSANDNSSSVNDSSSNANDNSSSANDNSSNPIANENSSRVEGVIPAFMGEMEIHHPRMSNLQIVESMSQRKELLRKDTDAVIAFPGGLGTLEEFLETYTLKRLGKYDGCVILFNQDGFYNSLLAMLDSFVQNRVLNSNYSHSLVVVNTVEQLLETLRNSKRETLTAAHYLPT